MEYIINAIVIGFFAGITPSVLTTLVITQTLKHNLKEGIIVSLAPVITDFPIALFAILILSAIAQSNKILGFISICGGLYLCYLAYKGMTVKKLSIDLDKTQPKSLRTAVITNFLNPNPYLFWLTIGAATFIKAKNENILFAISFVVVFYIVLILSKVAIALIVEKSKSFIKSSYYTYIIKVLGFLLLIFAFKFFKDGLKFLN